MTGDHLTFTVFGGNHDEIVAAAKRVIRDYLGHHSFDDLPDFTIHSEGMTVMSGQVIHFKADVTVRL